MLGLAAVQPQRLLILDHDRVDRNHPHALAGFHGLEARVDTLDAGVDVVDGDTRVVEGGLGDGVVTSPELELHHCAGLGGDLLGEELEFSLVVDGVHADGDDLDICG